MIETITARFEKGVLIPLQRTSLQERQTVRLQILPSGVRVSAVAACRLVNRFALDEISYLVGAQQPELIQTDRLVWRVPLTLAYPDRGEVGQVGYVDVDAESGELLDTRIEEIKRNARALAARSTPQAESPL